MRRPTGVPALAAVLAAGLLLAGCVGGADPPVGPNPRPLRCPVSTDAPFAVSIGMRSTSATPELPTDVSGPMYAAARAGAPVSVIRADGNPQVVFSNRLRQTGRNPQARMQEANTFVSRLQAAFGTPVRAVEPEADPLAALTLAADDTTAGGTIVMADSGLQTVSPLRFQEGGGRLFNAEPGEVVDYLRAARLVPHLEKRTVVFVGLGRAAGRQPTPDQRLRSRLSEIWSAIATQGGASCVEVRPDPPSAASDVRGLPLVSVVPLPPLPAPPVSCGETVLGEDDDIAFVRNQDVFRDEAAARATIGKIADVMRGRRTTALLVGTTARVGPYAGQVELSSRRAAAVKRVLVDLGITADRVRTTGVGSRWTGYVLDRGPHGELLPGPASANRKVVVRLTCPPA